MNTTVLQRGGDRHSHNMLKRAANYFSRALMSTRMVNTLNLRIECRSSKLKSNISGLCKAKANGSQSTKEFTVVLQRDDPWHTQVLTLAHELVHVYQGAMGTLQYRQWKSDGQLHTRWAGKDLGACGTIPYRERPWEIEAFALEETLFQAFLHHEMNSPEQEALYREQLSKQLNDHMAIRRQSNSREPTP
ncbi:hypothetical protein AB6D11_00895 [Vibrio splendidus]